MLSVHWTPHHRGSFGPYTDAGVFADWQPPFVKIVWDGSQVPYLEDIPPNAKIIWRNYPLSEQFHSGLNTGTQAQRLFIPSLLSEITPLGNSLPQNGSGRDLTAIPHVLHSIEAATDFPTPEQAAAIYVQNAIEVVAYCESKGVSRTRLLFEGPNEYPVWVHGYAGLARMEKARLIGLHNIGCNGIALNLGVGWPGNSGPDTPPVWDWAKNIIDVFNSGDYLGTHEYWADQGVMQNWGWWAGRILKCPYRVPVLVTECGIDMGVLGASHAKQGYYDLPEPTFDMRVERYLNELWEYAGLLKPDGRSKGLLIYTYDGNRTDWGRMDIRTEPFITPFLARIEKYGLPQPGTNTGSGIPTSLVAQLQKTFGTQFDDLRESLPSNGTYPTRSENSITHIIVHHTATVQTTWDNVARYHVNTKEWPGIGYHFGITPDGHVSYLGDIRTVRYHAGSANADSIGICFMGNYMNDIPTDISINNFNKLKLTIEQYLGKPLKSLGHRDVSQTECPGDLLYQKLFVTTPEIPEEPQVQPITIKVYDKNNIEQNLDWLVTKYNVEPVLSSAKRAFKLVEIRETEGASMILLRTLDDAGLPMSNIQVACSWTDAPHDLTQGTWRTILKDHGEIQETDGNGYSGFGIGDGSIYNPNTQFGPHCSWVLHNLYESDGLDGMGCITDTMLGPLRCTFMLMDVPVSYNTLDETLSAEAEANDVLSVNPNAALCKAGAARNLWPTSNEFPVVFSGIPYVAQRFRDPHSDLVVILYCIKDQWDKVFSIEE